jgi:hypothetical protein
MNMHFNHVGDSQALPPSWLPQMSQVQAVQPGGQRHAASVPLRAQLAWAAEGVQLRHYVQGLPKPWQQRYASSYADHACAHIAETTQWDVHSSCYWALADVHRGSTHLRVDCFLYSYAHVSLFALLFLAQTTLSAHGREASWRSTLSPSSLMFCHGCTWMQTPASSVTWSTTSSPNGAMVWPSTGL